MDGLGDRLFTAFLAENPFIDPLVYLVLEVGFGDMEAVIRDAIQSTSKPETSVPALLQDISPFTGFKGHPVRTGKSC
jgi:hypothetical protein